MADNFVELWLPLNQTYLPVLRSVAGVISGVAGFGYDDVVNLRTAVAETFDLVIRRSAHGSNGAAEATLTVRWFVRADRIETILDAPNGFHGFPADAAEEEGRDLLFCLQDGFEVATTAPNSAQLRLVKFRAGG